jgi:hypothetical protein
MNSNVEFNELYSKLTVTDEPTTTNFFDSLNHRENGFKIVNILMELGNCDVVEGFNSLSEDENINNFKKCTIRVSGDKFNEVYDKLLLNPNIKSLSNSMSDYSIGIIIK